MTDMTTRDELVVGLADELARDAATYAAGTPTRKLLHKAADALRRLAAAPLGDVREANFALLDFARNVAGLDEGALTRADLNYFRSLIREWRDEARAALDALVPAGGEGCILCANGNDLPDGEQCSGCGREGNATGLRAAIIKARGRSVPPTEPVHFAAALAPQNAGGESATQPGMNWELSEETKKQLAEIDDNRRHAMANIGKFIVGAPSEATPAPAIEASIFQKAAEFIREHDLYDESGLSKEELSLLAAQPAPADDAAVPQLEPWRDELSEIIGHLGAAIVQSIPKDDQIIMDHVKAAHEIAKIVRRKA